MKRIHLVLLTCVVLGASWWIGGAGCAAEDEDQVPCTAQGCSTGRCCVGGLHGTWNTTTGRCTCPGAADADADADADGDADADDSSGSGARPGSACRCDSDCGGVGTSHQPICVGGVCMLLGSAASCEPGSAAECPPHLRCWMNGSETHAVCWPDCDYFTGCVGDCDGDGSCVPNASTSCDPSCGTLCTS